MHAAVFTGIRDDIERDRCRSIVDINVAGTANLLDLARGQAMERFVYVSSGSVYGEGHGTDEALREDAVLNPRTLYASTKYTSELLTRRYGELHGFSTANTRLSSPYGPMERVSGHRVLMSVFYEWTGNVIRGEPIRVADRTLDRDYTYVLDIAGGICSVLDAPSLAFDVYNISAGPAVTLGQVIEAIQKVNPSVQVVDDPSKEFGILRPGSVRGVLDVTRLREDVGFTASYDVNAGIEDYLSWREEHSFRD